MIFAETSIADWPGDALDWVVGALGWIEHYLAPVILIALLVVELYVLVLIRKERRERETHIKAVHEHTNILSRTVYESAIEDGVRRAEDRIYCYWHSLHAEESDPRYESINKLLIQAHKEKRDVKLMIARDPSRIAAAYDLVEVGVPVVFQKALLISDLRFSLFDDKTTVVGISEQELNSDKPSRHGVGIENHKLNAMLLQYFKAEERTASSFREFLESVVTTRVLEDPTNTPRMIAQQLGIPIKEVEACCGASGSGGAT